MVGNLNLCVTTVSELAWETQQVKSFRFRFIMFNHTVYGDISFLVLLYMSKDFTLYY